MEKSKRYTIVIADRTTGVVRRFTISLRPTLYVFGLLFSLPVLVGLGAKWSAVAEIRALQSQKAALELENNSYRAATRELTTQIESVQEFATELQAQAKIDPNSARALAKLPASVRNGAMGGANSELLATGSALSPALASPDDTFGALRDMLSRLGSRLELVKDNVERRAALAAATPSIWPALGPLSASYGSRQDPFTGAIAQHSGIDISTEKGRSVYATAAGKVVAAAYSGDYGNLVTIDHGFGIVTRYAHLSGFAVRPGEQVERGRVIGYVGATGRATGPHLHYEILVNGQLTNPVRLLTDAHR